MEEARREQASQSEKRRARAQRQEAPRARASRETRLSSPHFTQLCVFHPLSPNSSSPGVLTLAAFTADLFSACFSLEELSTRGA